MRYVINEQLFMRRPPEGPLAAHVRPFGKWAFEQGYSKFAKGGGVPGMAKVTCQSALQSAPSHKKPVFGSRFGSTMPAWEGKKPLG